MCNLITMDFLGTLSHLMSLASSNTPVEIRSSSDIDIVKLELEKRVKSSGLSSEPVDLQIEAVKRFLQTGHIATLRDARRVAFGLVVPTAPNRACLMEEKELFGEALNEFDRWKNQSNPRQYSKCYQGLVRSYFDYDGEGRQTPEVGQVNWRKLRDYLNENANKIRSKGVNPDWITCATSNVKLFSDDPCGAYGKDLLTGKEDVVNEIRRLLNISDNSWFTWEIVLARLREATKLSDTAFQSEISSLLRLIGNKPNLRNAGLKILLNRHVKIPTKPQHHQLKDYSVACWGNPWLPSNNDSWGGISPEARQMVVEWLSKEYIELFFTKLAQDGLSDTRRVKFWSKYVKSIGSMYFALGGRARDPHERDFVELRQRLEGLTVPLQDVNGNNNAFIMQMGNLIAVEFSGRSNSFYGYDVMQGMPFDTSQTLYTPVDGFNSLKRSNHVLKLSHTDNIRGYAGWEDRFAAELRQKFGIIPDAEIKKKTADKKLSIIRPTAEKDASRITLPLDFGDTGTNNDSSKPIAVSRTDSSRSRKLVKDQAPVQPTSSSGSRSSNPSPFPKNRPFSIKNLHEFSVKTGFKIHDHSEKGGALWVYASYHIDNAREVLSAWGFKYTAGKGWWKKA